MAPQTWATQAQLDFLVQEDLHWEFTKSGSGTLKNFYVQTTRTFLQSWLVTIEPAMLESAGGDAAKVKQSAEDRVLTVSK